MRRAAGRGSEGVLCAGALRLRCSIGRAGLTHRKREGDGATPCGAFALLGALFRPDRLARPRYAGALRPSHARLGWCDEAGSRLYNRCVALPCGAGHEALWRADGLYDVLVVMDVNLRPRIARGGSAIFFHLVERAGAPTAGCVALTRADMARLLPRLARDAVLVVR